MVIKRISWLCLTLLSIVGVVSAQDNACPMLVDSILETVADSCTDLGRNQACYGNNDITTLDLDNNLLDSFTQVGDTEDVLNIASLTTAPFDVDTNTWGVAILSLQANLSDTLPGENVTFVVFGDTEINNAVPSDNQLVSRLSATSTGAINIRTGPSTSYTTAGSLTSGQMITLVARNGNGEWVRFESDEESGWVFASLINVDGDIASLPIVSHDGSQAYTKPIQAFSLKSGVGQPDCEEVPPDGVLLQTPADTVVHFMINGVEVQIGSTAFIQSDGTSVDVHTFEGDVSVTTVGETQQVDPGFMVSADSDSSPSEPEPYDFSDFNGMPTNLLPTSITIPIAIISDNVWHNTGTMVEVGDTLTFFAGGVINFWDFCPSQKVPFGQPDIDCDSLILGPDGGDPRNLSGDIIGSDMSLFPVPSAPPHSLVGRIGSSTFFIGTTATITATDSGMLELRTNDVDNNNLGAFIVATALSAP